MFIEKEIREANKTARSNGASAINPDGTIRAIVPNFIYKNIEHYRDKMILDYGAGKSAIHTKWLRENGLNVAAYDFGDNCIEKIHDKNALNKRYDVIFASNVLNVQSSDVMMMATVYQIYKSLKKGGTFIFNYPTSPRKTDMAEWEVIGLVSDIFKAEVVNNEGIFTITKPEDTDKKVFINIRNGLVEEIYSSDPNLKVTIIEHDEYNDEDIIAANKKAEKEQENYYKI
jgi:hypothetical protein